MTGAKAVYLVILLSLHQYKCQGLTTSNEPGIKVCVCCTVLVKSRSTSCVLWMITYIHLYICMYTHVYVHTYIHLPMHEPLAIAMSMELWHLNIYGKKEFAWVRQWTYIYNCTAWCHFEQTTPKVDVEGDIPFIEQRVAGPFKVWHVAGFVGSSLATLREYYFAQ